MQDKVTSLRQAFSPAPIGAVHVTGIARAIAGSADETGTFTFDVSASASSSLKLSLSSLSRTDIVKVGDERQCSWSGADGIQHDVPEHNCEFALNWVLPGMSIQSEPALQSAPASTINSLGAIAFTRTLSNADSKTQSVVARLSRCELLLDPSTYLAKQLTFMLHPDAESQVDIPVSVLYSDYRVVSGANIPFHIQKLVNNNLVLDLRVEDALISQ